MTNKTKFITYTAIFTALVAIATLFHLPVPGTQGFVNLGDGIILAVALTFGGLPALIAGGVGSALADIILGYAVWAPFTLVIKGIQGLLAYLLYVKVFKCKLDYLSIGEDNTSKYKGAIALIAASLFMVIGYYFASVVIIGTFEAAFVSIPSNLLQGFVGALIAYVLVFAVKIGKYIK